mgnify:CR=1 FL=1
MPATPLPLSTLKPGQRLRGLLALFILLVGLLAGVTMSHTQSASSASRHFSEVVMPSMKRVHDLVAAVDEVRGLSALHLLVHDDAERAALESRLSAERRMIDKRMAAYGKRLVDDIDRQHFEAVQKSLTTFWAAQDKLLAAARRAPGDPAAAAEARSLVSGEAQAAFRQLAADLEAWWAYVERLAEQAAASASQKALTLLLPSLLAVAIAALVGMVAGGLLARAQGAADGDTSGFASTLLDPHEPAGDKAPASRAAMLRAVEGARQGAPQSGPGPARRHPTEADTRSD